MVQVVGIRFKRVGKIYYFDPDNLEFQKSDRVIVETARGVECGEVVVSNREVPDDDIVAPLKKVMRIATQEDLVQLEQNKSREKEAFTTCLAKIREHKLEMKLIDAEYTFDGNKVLFYFTADGRVDFRNLVKDLALIFRTRIELRQIGVRDEAKMLGGLGICGRTLCCSTFLGEFEPVSIKMAKEQGLSLNPTKISGTCGRLMCCLKNEQDSYEDAIRRLPKVGAIVSTDQGNGIVVDVNLLRETLKLKLDKDNEKVYQVVKASEVKVIRDSLGNVPVEQPELIDPKLKSLEDLT
ncbi:MAG: stage 0 sporulation family protein [Hyphomonadaceae bacterium]|nr:stage 0 sporulation family protein [Clostridia bacterium]